MPRAAASRGPGPAVQLLGVDFTCAPSPRKPIVVARGQREGDTVHLQRLEILPTLAAFESLLAEPGPWFGAFDLPFGLPRDFVDALALGDSAAAVIAELQRRCNGRRMGFRALVDAWGNGRPAGQRLVHRATDRAGVPVSSSPLQTRYVPVGFMYFEGFARLARAGVHLPALRPGDAARVAVEAYPARAAQALIGPRSYKNSDSADRTQARADMLRSLQRGGGGHGLRLVATPALRQAMVDDAAGDLLDAALCLWLAAWAESQPGHGLPASVDPVEGWIIGPPPRAPWSCSTPPCSLPAR